MKFSLIIVYFSVIKVIAHVDVDFIIDYFIYRNVHEVVGFTCCDKRENIALVRRFGKVGIGANFGKFMDRFIIRRLIHTNYYKLGIYVDVTCNDSGASTALSIAAEGKLYDELHYWLMVLPHLNKVTDHIDDYTFSLATDFVLAVQFPSNHSYTLYDIYNPYKARGGKLNVTLMGSWNENGRLSVTLKQEKYGRRADLHGLYWKVYFFGSKYRLQNMSLENHFVDFEKTGTKNGLSKFGYNVIKHVAEMHNVSLLLGEYVTWKKGDRMGPISRALLYDDIDMGGTPINMFSDKLSMVKIAYTSWPFRTCFMFLSPPRTDIRVREVLSPLDYKVWNLIAVMLILFMTILTVILYFERMDSILDHFSVSFIILIGCLTQQGTNQRINRLSSRMVFSSIILFSLLIYNYYGASITSVRLNEPIIKSIDSLNSLAMTSMKVASEPMLYFEFFLHDNPKETGLFNKRKWEKVPENDRFIPPDKGMLLVKNRGWAYHTHPDVGYPYINRLYTNREICELMEIHLAKPTFRSIVVSYNSSFIEISKRGFTRLTEVGIRHRQLRRWTARKPRCRKNILSVSSITIHEVAPHLILLVIGMTLAFVLYIIEANVNKFKFRRSI